MNSFESGPTDTPRFALLPPGSDDTANKLNYAQLTKPIKEFSQRLGIHNEAPSFSDKIFNQAVGTVPPLDPALVEAVRANEAAIAGDPVFAKLNDFEPAEVKELRAKQATALAAWNSAKATLEERSQVYETRYKAPIDANRLATVTVVQAPGATNYLNNYYLNLLRTGDELQIKMGFDLASKVVVACVRLSDGGSCEVPADASDHSWPAKVLFNKSLGLLQIQYDLDAPADVGFPVLPRQPGGIQFNDIPASELVGRTLRFDFVLGQSQDELNAVTGLACINDSIGFPHYLGTTTGDDFFAKERQLKRRIPG